MLLLNDVVLILASSVISVILLAANVDAGQLRITLVGYAVLAGGLAFVQRGGQVAAAFAMGLCAYYGLVWLAMRRNVGTYLEDVSQKEKAPVFEGILPATSGITYNTYDPSASTYRRLPRSINRVGGAQFSYSVWFMFEHGVTDEAVRDATVFMRGDKNKYSPSFAPKNGSGAPVCYFNQQNLPNVSCEDYTVVCPRVFFLAADRLAVDINTDRKLRHRFLVGSEGYGVDTRKKALGLLPGHFALFTFVFEDNVDIDDFERGVRFTFYLNDQLYHTETVEGSLRQNEGNLHLMPDKTLPGAKFADFTYYNYALTDGEVTRLFSAGYNTADAGKARVLFNNKDSKLMMSAYNRLDMYNYK